MPTGAGYHVQPTTLHTVAGRIDDNAGRIRDTAGGLRRSNTSPAAFGQLGQGFGNSLNQHLQRHGSAVEGMAGRFSTGSSNMRTVAHNYTNVDTEAADRFRRINPDVPGARPSGRGGAGGMANEVATQPWADRVRGWFRRRQGGGNQPAATTAPSSAPTAPVHTPPPAPHTPTPPATPAGPAPGQLSGFVGGGGAYHFNPNDVASVPLHDSNGQLIGVGFKHDPHEITVAQNWAGSGAGAQHSNLISVPSKYNNPPVDADGNQQTPFVAALSDGGLGTGSFSKVPWKSSYAHGGPGPAYVVSHANEDYFVLPMKDGTSVGVDGATMANLVGNHPLYQQLSQAHPGRPVVLATCGVGQNAGGPGDQFADAMQQFPHPPSHVYGPTDTVSTGRFPSYLTGLPNHIPALAVDNDGRFVELGSHTIGPTQSGQQGGSSQTGNP